MKNLETSISIQAPVEKVWETLMNFENYPQWNPFIKSIKWKRDDQLDVMIDPGDKKPMNFKPVLLKKEKNKEFRWQGKMWFKGIFDGEHYFKLRKDEKGNTQLTHGEIFTGILSGLILKFIGKDTHEGFISMNEALKNEVEKNSL